MYATSRPIRPSETPQLEAVTTRSGSPEWELIRYQGVVSPGAYEEKTRARLGGLEPPRSHESSLARCTGSAGYKSGNYWLRVCVIPAPTTKYPSEYAKPAGARRSASLGAALRAIHPMAASSTLA